MEFDEDPLKRARAVVGRVYVGEAKAQGRHVGGYF